MAGRKKSKSDIMKQQLCDLAYGKITDAVSLLFLSDEEILERLPKMKLINVSEIKRPKGGGMEIKFFDRIKAFDKLCSLEEGGSSEALGFYDALEKSANSISFGGNDEI